jgi:hypothetical protein
MEWFIYAVTLLFLCLGAYIAYVTYRVRQEVRAKQEALNWIYEQLDRALDLIDSKDPDEICVGLQMISTLNDPVVRLKALNRLVELSRHENRCVAEQAGVALEKASHPVVS